MLIGQKLDAQNVKVSFLYWPAHLPDLRTIQKHLTNRIAAHNLIAIQTRAV